MASVNKEVLHRLYVDEKRSMPDVARLLGMNYSAARTAILKAGISPRSRVEGIRAVRHKLGEHARGTRRTFSAEWKAKISAARRKHSAAHAVGLSYKTSGYVAITRGPNKGRNLHGVIMEQHIGRPLRRDEIVHHRDENKHNNVLANLELMTRSEHARLHLAERRARNGIR